MEVGAVKQAFNNEVIHLKKKLNQAKTQTIHKLTRKAKTLTEKKAPEKVQAKLRRKAVSAVQEVLLIKKITAKDIARFAVTHKGELNSYLNRPTIDNDKACARLLLHKTLEDKYKFLRETFTDLAIDDLLMSREERKKMKKEAKEKSKKKKKGNNSSNSVNTEGDWSIEDVNINSNKHKSNSDGFIDESEDEKSSGNETKNCNLPEHKKSDVESKSTQRRSPINKQHNIITVSNLDPKPNNEIDLSLALKERVKKVANKKQDDTKKSKKVTDKFLAKRTNKAVEMPLKENKIVDPFFVTSSGESYMSLVEPRLPDEVKDVHDEGNRKLRRAAMFGHVPKIKPRKENSAYRNQNGRHDKPDRRTNSSGSSFEAGKNGKFERRNESGNKSEAPEKLHPSWEAKKRQSGLLPFKGKKIVFE